ncbi:MAG: plasmid pRiA4b ORF-3 family protein [Oscillospiraceae bacterium]|jgi:hypothetical protein|nr:plasmid pRiA4b ORF-3 family protein [Oscillospiraceae bacterium]
MQIALTKKLADASGAVTQSEIVCDPLYSWVAGWTNVYSDRKEDLIVMVNAATRFVVTIYGVRRRNLKGIAAKMTAAIRNTLLALNLNPEIVDEYLERAGEVQFTVNHDRSLSTYATHAGTVFARYLYDRVYDVDYDDTLGRIISRRPINLQSDSCDIPEETMLETLKAHTDKPMYIYRAFELLVTLDLDIYIAKRRLIVPSNLSFTDLHSVLQSVFDWKNSHLYEYIAHPKKGESDVYLLANEDTLDFIDNGVLMDGHTLSEYLPEYKSLTYIYDFGDYWEHEIELVRVIDKHDAPSPYLLEAEGKSPPEDVGGVGGFIEFRKIMLDPNHPEHEDAKKWAGYWNAELSDYSKRPRAINV